MGGEGQVQDTAQLEMVASTWGLLLRAIKKGWGCCPQEVAGVEEADAGWALVLAGLMLCKWYVAVS